MNDKEEEAKKKKKKHNLSLDSIALKKLIDTILPLKHYSYMKFEVES